MALCMVLSVCFFSVAAAPEGTAITSETEFLAMDPSGTYYLANDITINTPYASAFTGTFDGNGKTVTISQPMFVNFGGTIKNLVIEGSVTSLAADAEIAALADNGARGAVASRVNSGTEVVFENIVNNAAISATGSLSDDDCAGGIVGKVENAEATVTFTNCVNNGTITGLNQVGGLAGYIKAAASALFEKCVNNGEIKETKSGAYSGGIICRSDCNTKYIDCVNNGKISSGKDQAGGILAYAGKASHEFFNCANYGEIAPTVGKAGGIVGSINSNDADGKNGEYIKIENCVNYGKITSVSIEGTDAYAGGIIAQAQKNLNTVITNCANYGEIAGAHDSGAIMGHTTQAVLKISYCENFAKVSSNDSYAGGMVGYGWGTKTATYSASNGDYANIVEYCINHGEITGASRAGGIIASTGASDSRGITLVQYNINLGNVTSNGTKTNASSNCAGGIVGYAYGSGQVAHPVINANVSVGNVEQKNSTIGNASYFLGYVNNVNATVTNNTALGTITNAAPNTAVLGWNNGQVFAAENMVGNSIPASNTLPHTYESTKIDGVATPVTDKVYTVGATDESDLTSGKIVYEYNQACKAAGAESDILYMNLDGTFAPTLVPNVDDNGLVLNAVVTAPDGTFTNPEPAPETTEPAPETTEPAPETTEPAPETTEPAPETTEPGSSTPTGDSALIFAVIAVISVLGVAVVAKKREN